MAVVQKLTNNTKPIGVINKVNEIIGRMVVEEGNDGVNWYRKHSDGYIEQG